MNEWITVKDLARHGVSVSEIARRTGHDRKTIRGVLAQTTRSARPPTWRADGGKLAPFRDYLERRLAEGCGNAVVLCEEIRAQGYQGQLSILRDFLRPHRQELRRQREATVRFETGPGKQAQVDWGEFGTIWVPAARRRQKLYGFVFTLGYSRAQYVEFTTCCDLEHFVAAHLGAFQALGIPETILYDNLKTAILGRRPDGSPVFPGRFLDFALYAGFTPKFCQPYRPRTKGKVERGVGYVRQNFWVRVGQDVRAGTLDLAGLNQRARTWSEQTANQRVHGTHGAVVWERYRDEAPVLGRLVGRPAYDTGYHALRRVSRDGRLSYRGVKYQVSLSQALREVQVHERLDGAVSIYARTGALLPAAPVVDALAPWSAERPAAGPGEMGPGEMGPEAALLIVGHEGPIVPARELAVYEEVARAASIG
ncbi:MAG: IS21 family transposase [Acetobacteraceae bacterium]|nr:IS21 family transposase [Solirubrobacterales bacterium]MBV8578373.1 IS21 family transposase [Acetobacteraceae bacterium]